MPRHFGDYIRIRREDLGLNQQELADQMDATKEEISMWEQGRRVPSPYYHARLTEFLGLSAKPTTPEEILAGPDETQSATLGWLVKRKRVESNLTLVDVGRLLAVKPTTWEDGRQARHSLAHIPSALVCQTGWGLM